MLAAPSFRRPQLPSLTNCLPGANSTSVLEMKVGHCSWSPRDGFSSGFLQVPAWSVSCTGGSVPWVIGQLDPPGTVFEKLFRIVQHVLSMMEEKARVSNIRYLCIFSCSLDWLLLIGFIPAGWFLLQSTVASFRLHRMLPCQISSLLDPSHWCPFALLKIVSENNFLYLLISFARITRLHQLFLLTWS